MRLAVLVLVLVGSGLFVAIEALGHGSTMRTLPARAAAATYALAGAPVQGTLRGRVIERLPAGSYVYLQVAADSGETWIVLPAAQAPAPSATDVEVRLMRRAEKFHSRRLGREFSVLYFAKGDR